MQEFLLADFMSMTPNLINLYSACDKEKSNITSNVNCNNNQGNLDNIRSNVADLNSMGWNDRIASYLCVAV